MSIYLVGKATDNKEVITRQKESEKNRCELGYPTG